MDAAFGAVCVDIKLLQIRLSAQHTDSCSKSSPTADEILDHLCQHCEASLQFLLSLCQQKLFREHLVKNKVFFSLIKKLFSYILQIKGIVTRGCFILYKL